MAAKIFHIPNHAKRQAGANGGWKNSVERSTSRELSFRGKLNHRSMKVLYQFGVFSLFSSHLSSAAFWLGGIDFLFTSITATIE